MTVTADPREEGSADTTRSRSTTTAQDQNQSAMSLTYSDFIYNRHEYPEVNLGQPRDERRLPSDFKPIQETKVPLTQVDDIENHDFIIIAEFSEQEGPVPLCTVPNDIKTDIKLCDFVVHLMSTDYLVNTVGQFRICQDTQVMRKNVFPNVHVFMQYFTLYDIKARGFVRPFCFGYVSKDHIKLDKYINFLMTEFGKVTSVLEHCNREWFAKELEIYLQKLENAKDVFIKEHNKELASATSSNESENSSGDSGDADSNGDLDNKSDEFVDTDTVTLAQIAHQFSEIKNILTVVQSFEHSNQTFNQNVMVDIFSFFNRHADTPIVQFLKKVSVCTATTNTARSSFDSGSPSLHSTSPESLNIPLVHPLRFNGEALRPLTVLGQLGSVYLVGKLMQIYSCCKMDIIFTEMTETTVAFRQHFERLSLQQANNNNENDTSPGRSSGISADFDNSTGDTGKATDVWLSEETREDSNHSSDLHSPFELLLGDNHSSSRLWSHYSKKELLEIIEKLHASAPFANSDNKSGSYHTASEEDSDLNITSAKDMAAGMEFDCDTSVLESTIDDGSVTRLRYRSEDHNELTTAVGGADDHLKMHSFSSDEDVSLHASPTRIQQGTSEETISKEPWWIHASRKLVGGVPGYGIAKFFRRYHATAHHILYSILLGRPIIICGEEKKRRKIGEIITALIPLVPLPPGGQQQKSWKLLRWHQGILVQAHIESYKIIGLCIPEKLEVHDLIPSRLVTLVTILSADKKTILGGPAYSGDILQSFSKNVQTHFSNCDVSLLSYIGGLYADVEAKVYMYKCLVDKYSSSKGKFSQGNNIPSLMRELNLRASDVEIVKYLCNLIPDPCDCVNIL